MTEDTGRPTADKPMRARGRLAISASLQPRDLMADRPALKGAWRAKVITLFPEAFPGTLGLSLTGKALDQGLWALEPIDLRPFGEGKHRNVDDTPAGGGAGMVLRADIVGRALSMAALNTPSDRARWPVVYMSPRGRPLTQAMAQRFAQAEGMTILCGRFEGVDDRALEHFNVEEVSLGDFVLTGGEIAATALIDAAVRLIPRVLGNQESTENESFSDGLLEHPQYTRPSVWEGHDIPDILLSGDHGRIAEWRQTMAERLTQQRRPDLWRAYCAKHGRDPVDDQEL
ncbi:tRNA (guanosine(37)-N1)-methyltransferase TrmD [Roseicitreum antarcticum]|uniref:tRNA (guanine-N(1)-)-methyltransferase n=1 Tax=Roseicitreum antarcticum TaxID=564137 RepID=A0A1H2RVH4_9RHOB|nr:tRNA (guanosine(37)-N1)-methyltransferase TrmD [Roseicitreum antarcticum]SDW23258.1 tRNA (Guanine37-N(1)-) methyltransferase [Roseicitreum antarcticum]